MKQRDLLDLADTLLDSPTREIYGVDAFSIFANSLGISSGSVLDLDAKGEIRFQCAPAEVERRIRHVKAGKEQGLSFFQSMDSYLQHSPQPDPLAEFDPPSSETYKQKRRPGRVI
jgi:hypothetical protein